MNRYNPIRAFMVWLLKRSVLKYQREINDVQVCKELGVYSGWSNRMLAEHLQDIAERKLLSSQAKLDRWEGGSDCV